MNLPKGGRVMKKTMLAIIFVAIALLMGCAMVTMKDNNRMLSKKNPTVVIIAGESETIRSQMKTLQNAFPDTVLVISKKFYPPNRAADEVLKQLQDKNIEGPIILIGYSWFGHVARMIDAENPNLVVAIVTIGTALGNFRFTPEFISDIFFRPHDNDSQTPLYVLGAVSKNVQADHWWIIDKKQSDGLVGIASVMDTGKRVVKEKAIFYDFEHCMLLEDSKSINQIKAWLNPWLKVEKER
jgi:pimeloyl-ACP methyl ester carboxylesterase